MVYWGNYIHDFQGIVAMPNQLREEAHCDFGGNFGVALCCKMLSSGRHGSAVGHNDVGDLHLLCYPSSGVFSLPIMCTKLSCHADFRPACSLHANPPLYCHAAAIG